MVNRWYKIKNMPIRKRQALHSLGVGLAFSCFAFLFTYLFDFPLCLFKRVFGISCLGCGLTRGFIAILRLEFKKATDYNVLSVPLFLGIGIFSFCCVIDAVWGKDFVEKIEKQLSKKYMYGVYIIIMIVATILNSH